MSCGFSTQHSGDAVHLGEASSVPSPGSSWMDPSAALSITGIQRSQPSRARAELNCCSSLREEKLHSLQNS